MTTGRHVPRRSAALTGHPAEDGRHQEVEAEGDLHHERSPSAALSALSSNLLDSDGHRLVLLKLIKAASLPEPVQHTPAEIPADGILNELVLKPPRTGRLSTHGLMSSARKVHGHNLLDELLTDDLNAVLL